MKCGLGLLWPPTSSILDEVGPEISGPIYLKGVGPLFKISTQMFGYLHKL